MAQLKHMALAPGRLCVGRNDKNEKVFRTFTPEDCKAFYERGVKMIEKNVPIPAVFSHTDAGPDNWPEIFADTEKAKIARERGIVGFAAKYELGSDGKVWVYNEYPDPADAAQAQKTKFCSPRIKHFTDKNGTDYDEVFTHLALTGRPVQHDQPPAVKLGIDLAIDEESGEDRGGEEKSEKSEKPPEKKSAPPEDKKGSGGMKMHKALSCLESLGLMLGADTPTDLDGFLDRLIVAVETKAAAGGAASPAALPGKIGPSTEVPPMTLSIESLEAKMKARDAVTAKREGVALLKRIDALFASGRIDVPIKDRLKAEAGAIQLSVADDGDVVATKVHYQVEAFEAMKPNSMWQATELSYGPAREPGAAMTDAEALAAWDAQ